MTPTTHGVRVRALGFPPPFFTARLIASLLALLPLSAAVAAGAGIAWFAWLIVPLAISTVPERCTVTAHGVELRWATLSEWIEAESIEGLALVADPRRWVVGARRPVLEVRRLGARPLLLSAASDVLSELRDQLRSKLNRGAECSTSS